MPPTDFKSAPSPPGHTPNIMANRERFELHGNPHLVAEVADKTVDDIEEMTETEFAYFLAENGVL